jgi:hypothetical protein
MPNVKSDLKYQRSLVFYADFLPKNIAKRAELCSTLIINYRTRKIKG